MKTKVKKAIQSAKQKHPKLKNTKFKVKERYSRHPIKIVPTMMSYFKRKHKRKYKVVISKNKKEKLKKLSEKEIEEWVKNELAFVLESQALTSIQLIGYTLQYLLEKRDSYKNESNQKIKNNSHN